MATYNVQIPPMPKPEDFGIKEEDWGSTYTAAQARLGAYKHALEVWKQAVVGLRNANPLA